MSEQVSSSGDQPGAAGGGNDHTPDQRVAEQVRRQQRSEVKETVHYNIVRKVKSWFAASFCHTLTLSPVNH